MGENTPTACNRPNLLRKSAMARKSKKRGEVKESDNKQPSETEHPAQLKLRKPVEKKWTLKTEGKQKEVQESTQAMVVESPKQQSPKFGTVPLRKESTTEFGEGSIQILNHKGIKIPDSRGDIKNRSINSIYYQRTSHPDPGPRISDHHPLLVKWGEEYVGKKKSFRSVWDCRAPNDSSWHWKKLMKIKEVMKAGFSNGKWLGNGGKQYIASSGYTWLRGEHRKDHAAKIAGNGESLAGNQYHPQPVECPGNSAIMEAQEAATEGKECHSLSEIVVMRTALPPQKRKFSNPSSLKPSKKSFKKSKPNSNYNRRGGSGISNKGSIPGDPKDTGMSFMPGIAGFSVALDKLESRGLSITPLEVPLEDTDNVAIQDVIHHNMLKMPSMKRAENMRRKKKAKREMEKEINAAEDRLQLMNLRSLLGVPLIAASHG
ncbi:OLC1v1004977C1 [Oldenlandia corymbosa var. corymbosa]|uniref:OLC1v1004977C1 n=1 Tax=Oldenlandia corymbosa var. corymbosa TaxID=529605 RepID=A0AAV1DDJ9_OLDCO|nr:OLC1v1004977C1 [Oldenlandia corymbosa var. corymbosa]